jgi:hypothetical protein
MIISIRCGGTTTEPEASTQFYCCARAFELLKSLGGLVFPGIQLTA